jgi:serine-type D-Ala-D-Ala carboxypeptidase (penicillin-binding protein 5/6)
MPSNYGIIEHVIFFTRNTGWDGGKTLKKNRFWKVSASGALIATLLFSTSLPLPQSFAPYANVQVAHAEEQQAAAALNIQSPAGLLMDAKSGQILWNKDMNAKRYPASVTKIMTLLLTFEAVEKGEKKLTDIVPISNVAYGTEGSSVWLDPKEQWTLADMIEFIAIPSANDACVATAEFVGGSEEGFVARMNAKAKELGMTGTQFSDSNGLHDPNHYSTAHDIALMARELITKYPQILETTKIQSKMIRDGKFKLENTNHLLGQYPGMDGLKTGFTDEAGNNLVGTAERDGLRLISVELGAPTDAIRVSDSKAILDYGFSNFKEETLVKKGESPEELAKVTSGKNEEVQTVAAQDLSIAVKKDSGKFEKKVVYKDVTAPVKKDDVLGQLQVVQDGKVIASVDLLAKEDVEKGSWIRLMFRGIGDFFGGLFSAIGSVVSGFFN